MVMESQEKWILKSKTVWFGLFTALASFYVPAQEFVAQNMEAMGILWGAVAFVLRVVSKDKLILK